MDAPEDAEEECERRDEEGQGDEQRAARPRDVHEAHEAVVPLARRQAWTHTPAAQQSAFHSTRQNLEAPFVRWPVTMVFGALSFDTYLSSCGQEQRVSTRSCHP